MDALPHILKEPTQIEIKGLLLIVDEYLRNISQNKSIATLENMRVWNKPIRRTLWKAPGLMMMGNEFAPWDTQRNLPRYRWTLKQHTA
jgi:hypothetical protein